MTFRAIAFLIGLFALSLGGGPAQAQNVNLNCWNPNATSGLNQWLPCNATTPLQIAGSISASLGGFTPSASGARGTPLAVTTSDSSGNLPTGAVVVVANVGANPMYCNVNGAAATTSDQYISSSGGWFAFTIPAAVTTLHCIATGGSTTANTVGGAGLPTGTGGGGGGGGGGAITAATGSYASGALSSGSIVDVGTQADAACSTDTGTCTLIALQKRGNQNIAASVPAGTNPIGTVTGNVNVTPTNCSGTITSGGTAQNAFAAAATIHGFTIANMDSTAGSGEPLWISFTTTAAASTAASYPLSAPAATTFTGLSSFTSPLGLGMNTALSIVGATTGHKFSCVTW